MSDLILNRKELGLKLGVTIPGDPEDVVTKEIAIQYGAKADLLTPFSDNDVVTDNYIEKGVQYDDGLTWVNNNGAINTEEKPLCGAIYDRENNSVIAFGTASLIVKSDDSGASWEKIPNKIETDDGSDILAAIYRKKEDAGVQEDYMLFATDNYMWMWTHTTESELTHIGDLLSPAISLCSTIQPSGYALVSTEGDPPSAVSPDGMATYADIMVGKMVQSLREEDKVLAMLPHGSEIMTLDEAGYPGDTWSVRPTFNSDPREIRMCAWDEGVLIADFTGKLSYFDFSFGAGVDYSSFINGEVVIDMASGYNTRGEKILLILTSTGRILSSTDQLGPDMTFGLSHQIPDFDGAYDGRIGTWLVYKGDRWVYVGMNNTGYTV